MAFDTFKLGFIRVEQRRLSRSPKFITVAFCSKRVVRLLPKRCACCRGRKKCSNSGLMTLQMHHIHQPKLPSIQHSKEIPLFRMVPATVHSKPNTRIFNVFKVVPITQSDLHWKTDLWDSMCLQQNLPICIWLGMNGNENTQWSFFKKANASLTFWSSFKKQNTAKLFVPCRSTSKEKQNRALDCEMIFDYAFTIVLKRTKCNFSWEVLHCQFLAGTWGPSPLPNSLKTIQSVFLIFLILKNSFSFVWWMLKWLQNALWLCVHSFCCFSFVVKLEWTFSFLLSHSQMALKVRKPTGYLLLAIPDVPLSCNQRNDISLSQNKSCRSFKCSSTGHIVSDTALKSTRTENRTPDLLRVKQSS